jgi:hypothetical protein
MEITATMLDQLRQRVPPNLHPSAQRDVRHWLSEAKQAVADGDQKQVVKILGSVGQRIGDELLFEAATDRRGGAEPLRRAADRWFKIAAAAAGERS